MTIPNRAGHREVPAPVFSRNVSPPRVSGALAKQKQFVRRIRLFPQPPLLPKPCGLAAGSVTPFEQIFHRLIGLAPRPDAIPIRSHAPGWASQGARPGFFFGGSFPGDRLGRIGGETDRIFWVKLRLLDPGQWDMRI
jgi:hypothetical protein